MSTDIAKLVLPEHPLATHLKKCGIDSVLLIDDAFDPFDVDALQDEIGVLWDHIIRSDELKADLIAINPDVDDRSKIDNDLITELFKQRDILPHLGPFCKETLFADKISKLAELEPLKSHFDAIGIRILERGSDEALPDEQCKLIFLDYSLGSDANISAVANARTRAEDIYKSSDIVEEKPFIVLMSSKPDADVAQEDFREKSGLLGGLFAFLKRPSSQIARNSICILLVGHWECRLDIRSNDLLKHWIVRLRLPA